MPFGDYHLAIEYESPLSFDMSCNKYIRIFNKLMSCGYYAFDYYEKMAPKSLNDSYMFKRGTILSVLDILRPKGSVK